MAASLFDGAAIFIEKSLLNEMYVLHLHQKTLYIMTRYVRFDWAMKKLLRNKTNFVVLEGLISTLLNKDIHITTLLESESNQDYSDSKQNRVDIAAQNENGEKYIIEIQAESEVAYFQRILFGTSNLIREYLKRGSDYSDIKKVYSINIVYFDLGRGKDYVYHGTTEFRGIHSGDVLSLSPFQREKFDVEEVKDLFPEYFILKVNGFDEVATTPLQEWIDFLKNETIPEHPKAKGLSEAKEIMAYEHMSTEEKAQYDKHLENVVILRDNILTARGEGRIEGRFEGRMEGRMEGIEEGRKEGIEEGRKEGLKEGIKQTAIKMKRMGIPISVVCQATGLDEDYLLNLSV